MPLIRISEKFKTTLDKKGKKKETYEDVIQRMIKNSKIEWWKLGKSDQEKLIDKIKKGVKK